MAEQFSIPTPGDMIAGKYLILEELGRGAYGVVFRARQQGIERDVALKTLLPQAFLHQDVIERFHREARLVSRLQHPNLVTLFDFGQSNGVLYMVMELIQGWSLKQLIDDEAPVKPERAIHIISQICRALHIAHREGVVHRDLKPENIFLTRYKEDPDFVKVLDFGIAKIQHGDALSPVLKTLTVKGYVLGTPHYMSPENISGEPVTAAADLYAVGILLYELLTGEHPYDAPTPSAVLVRHLHDDIPSLPDPEMNRSPLGTALQCALTKDPEERVASALQFIDILNGDFEVEVELEPLLEVVSEPTHAEPPRPTMPAEEPLTLPGQKTLALFAVLAVCIVLLGVVLGFVLVSSGRPPTATSETVDIGGQSHQQETHNNSNPTSITYDFNTDEVSGPAQDGGHPSTSGDDQRSTSDTRGLVPSKDAQRPASALRRTTDVQSPEAASAEKTAVEHKASDVAPKEASKTPAVARTVLRVTSDPPGAKVLVNGQPAGLTPCTRQVRQGGVVRVKISKVGYKTEMRTLSPKGRNHALSVRLKPGRIKLSP